MIYFNSELIIEKNQNFKMFKKSRVKISNKKEILTLTFLLIITAIFTISFNYTQKKIINNYNNLINNVYFKKTTKHFLDKFEPKYKKIRHQIVEGETFDNILKNYFIDKKEIQKLKKNSLKKLI